MKGTGKLLLGCVKILKINLWLWMVNYYIFLLKYNKKTMDNVIMFTLEMMKLKLNQIV